MSVHMSIHMSIHMSGHMSVHMSVHRRSTVSCPIHVSVHMFIIRSTHICTHMPIHICTHMSTHTSTHTCVYTRLHTHGHSAQEIDDELFVLLYEFRHDLDAYLATRRAFNVDGGGVERPIATPPTFADIVQFNKRRCAEELALFGQAH